MKIMQSMRGQIALGVSVMLVVLWLLAVLGSAFVIKGEINESFDAALQETGERILPLAVVELIGSDGANGAQRILPITQHDEKITYVIRNSQGAILMYSHDADLEVFDRVSSDGFFTTQDHRVQPLCRVGAIHDPSGRTPNPPPGCAA